MKTYLQMINPSLNSHTRAHTVQFSPGRAVSVGPDVTLAFFIPHDVNDEPFPFDDPDSFTFDIQIDASTLSRVVALEQGNQLILQNSNRLLIWPVAVELECDTHQVLKVFAQIESLDPVSSHQIKLGS